MIGATGWKKRGDRRAGYTRLQTSAIAAKAASLELHCMEDLGILEAFFQWPRL
jgi:hypothetical protein